MPSVPAASQLAWHGFSPPRRAHMPDHVGERGAAHWNLALQDYLHINHARRVAPSAGPVRCRPTATDLAVAQNVMLGAAKTASQLFSAAEHNGGRGRLPPSGGRSPHREPALSGGVSRPAA